MGKKKENVKQEKGNDIPHPEKPKRSRQVLTIKTKLSDNNCLPFLNGECLNKECKDIHNYSLKFQKENNQQFASSYNNIAQDFILLKPIQDKIFKQTTLDLMFIMDCTGSMTEWIKATKEELATITTFIQSNNPYSKVRVSFVGYRDYCDKYSLNKQKIAPVIQPVVEGGKHQEYERDYLVEPNHGEYTGRYDIIDFDEDIGKIQWFISGVKAFGGGDFPEDVAGGLKKGLEQSWSSPAKYCVFVCDAPGHGKQYHNILGDSYPKGDPNGLILEELILEYARKNINFYFIQIDPQSTQKMINIMSESYQTIARKPINVSNMGNSTNDFTFFVAFGASCALNSVTMNGMSIAEFLNDIKNEAKIEEEKLNINNVLEHENKAIMIEEEDVIQPQKQEENNLPIVDQNFDFQKNYIGSMNQSLNYQMNSFFERIGTMVGNQIEPFGENINMKMSIDNRIEHMNKKSKEEMLIADFHISKVNINIDLNKEENYQTYPVICHSYYISNPRNSNINWTNPFIESSEIDSTLQLANQPFAEGAMRFAFYGKDIDLNQSVVAKIPKEIKKEDYTLQNLSKDLESLVICHHISNDFNSRIINYLPDSRLLINFVNAWIYEINNPDVKFNLLNVENEIKGTYEKYNNNAGWITKHMNEITQVAQCFSHFSWQITKGHLAIVDLQGVGGELTDPQIHCLDMKKYGKGNLGYVGMLKFFLSHSCNNYCKNLGLIHPNEQVDIKGDFDFYIEKYVKPTNNRLINKICDLCYKPFLKDEGLLHELRKRHWEAFCEECDGKRKDSWGIRKCGECKKAFTASKYYYKMKRKKFPTKCDFCREKLHERDIEDNQQMNIDNDDESNELKGNLFG